MLFARGYRLAGLLMAVMFVLIPQSASASPAYYLAPGAKLTVGQCITSTSHSGTAKLCMAPYGNVNIYFNGTIVDQFGANARSNTASSAYLTTTATGYIRIYQYAGGPLIWHYDKFVSLGLRNLGLAVSSSPVLGGWCVSVSDLSTYSFPWRGPTCFTG